MSEGQEHLDQSTDQAMQAGQKVGKKTKDKAKKKGKEAAKKAGKKIAKAGAQALKVAAKALLQVIVAFLPFIAGGLLILFLSMAAYDMLYESRPKDQEYQMESVEEENTYGDEVDEEGDYPVVDISDGNKLVKAFYTHFSDKSYYFIMDDDDTLYGADHDIVEKNGVVDKFNREKMFYLSPTALFVLDEYLNEDEFRTPEQFVQPVPYEWDKNAQELKLKEIADEKTKKVQVKSKQYNDKGERTDKDVPGVWDYGFAPVFHYKSYMEEEEYRGATVSTQQWDKETQQMIDVSIEPEDAVQKTETIGETTKVWMIDQLASGGGTIKNEIIEEWKDTHESWNTTEATTKKVEVRKYKMMQQTNKEGKNLYWSLKEDGSIDYDKKPTTDKNDKPYEKMSPYYVEEDRTHITRIEGTKWQKSPIYIGEPDMSGVTGTKYFTDYFENYEIYVPGTVVERLDVAKRLGMNDKEVQELIDGMDEASPDSGVDVDVTGLELGGKVDGGAYKKALQNLDMFQTYGRKYGVDPYLLVALTAQEAGGSHYTASGTVKGWGANAGNNIGIMQIGRVGGNSRSVTAFNQETGRNETVTYTYEQLSDINNNVHWGTMYLATQIAKYDYSIPKALQAYNYGSWPPNTPWSDEASLAYQKKHSKGVPRDPKRGMGPWNYGDAYYVKHVLRHYASPETKEPYMTKTDGTTVSMDGSGTSIEMGSVGSINSTTLKTNSTAKSYWGSFTLIIRRNWEGIKKGITKVFDLDKDGPEYEGIDTTKRERFKRDIDYDEAHMITMLMLAFDEEKKLSDYDNFDEEDFKERFKAMFTNPFGEEIGNTVEDNGVDPAQYFNDGFVSPVKSPNVITKFGFYTKDDKEIYHPGIDIAVTNGQDIYAVARGKVLQAKEDQLIIEHTLGTTTHYRYVSNISVKVGDMVDKGQKIAKGGNSSEKEGTFHFELKQNGRTHDPTFIVDPSKLKGSGGGGVGEVVIDPNAMGILQAPFPGQTGSASSSYGYRIHPIYKTKKFHAGWDIISSKGSGAPIHSIYDGKVIVAKYHSGWGYYIVIDHGIVPGLNPTQKFFSLYAHTVKGSFKVNVGDTVVKGQHIAGMGTTGSSTGDHLHLETRFGPTWGNTKTVEPATIVTAF